MSQQAINYRVTVYINGHRFDPISVSVTSGRNQYAQFQVEVPSIPQWDMLPPRSHAVVFYADPVTNSWRMMCEGEYISYTKVKTSTGQRSRSLMFRSLQGVFESATLVQVAGLFNGNDTGLGSLRLLANGHRLTPASDTNLDTPSLDGLMETVSRTDDGNRLSAFFPELIKRVMAQLPVEAFYMYNRQILQKQYTLEDTEIVNALDSQRLLEMSRTGLTGQITNSQMTLHQLFTKYLSIALYQFTSILSPPRYRPPANGLSDASSRSVEGSIIPEVFYSPDLYAAIPPACNVIFNDQITTLSQTRNFAIEPTRVITEVSHAQQGVPHIYMSNSVESSWDIAQFASGSAPAFPGHPGQAATHALISSAEMERGIIPQTVNFRGEFITGSEAPPTDGSAATAADPNAYEFYLSQASRHHYEVAVGHARNCQLQCTFLPYLVPGLPALVEERTGSFHATVMSVTHTLSNQQPPTTSVTLTHVREAYDHEGHDHTPPVPNWMNKYYRPAAIANGTAENPVPTWELLFGQNALEKPHSAMVPPELIVAASKTKPSAVSDTSGAFDSPDQVNMDVLASHVVEVPRYSEDYSTHTVITKNTIAKRLRDQSDAPMAMMRYNWRPGVTLSDFVAFHGLREFTSAAAADAFDRATIAEAPSSKLREVEKSAGGHPLFGAPYGITLAEGDPMNDSGTKTAATLKVTDDGQIGAYKLLSQKGKLISDYRERATALIQSALTDSITES